MMTGSLSYLRVLDLSHSFSASTGAQMLASLGAEIISIHKPSTKPCHSDDISKSLSIDLSKEEGRAIAKALVRRCDLVIEDMGDTEVKRLGVCYRELSNINPKLVYCSLPHHEQGDSEPVNTRSAFEHYLQQTTSSQFAVTVALSALVTAEREGQGQHIDLAQFEPMQHQMQRSCSAQIHAYLGDNTLPGPHPYFSPYQVFPTSNGGMTVAVSDDDQFFQLCLSIGREDLASDPRFIRNANRVNNRELLAGILSMELAKHDSAHWQHVLTEAGVPNDILMGLALGPNKRRTNQMDLFPNVFANNVVQFSQDKTAEPKSETSFLLQKLLGFDSEKVSELEEAAVI